MSDKITPILLALVGVAILLIVAHCAADCRAKGGVLLRSATGVVCVEARRVG